MERRDDWKADKAYLKELKRQYKADRKEDRRDYQQRVRYGQNTPEFWQRSTYNRNPSGYNYNNRYSGQYDNRYNDDRYDEYNDGVSWKQRLLSTVLSQLVGGAFGNSNQQSNGYGYNQPQYGYNDAQYDQPQYSGYDGGRYNNSGYDAYNPGSFINALPYAEMINRYSGGLATDMIRQALGMGYDEGYLAGQYARTNGTADDYYSDPYTYPNGSYDGASISLAERRQILSEGYKLGYQDALDGRNSNDYDPQTEGDTNLVSLLLNNVLRII